MMTHLLRNLTARDHVVLASYVSILCGILEGGLGFLASERKGGSDSVLGVIIMGLADACGSVLVIWMWQITKPSTSNVEARSARLKETFFAGCIGMLMGWMGVGFLHTSARDLWNHGVARSAGASVAVACFGAAASFMLYYWKMKYGKELGSIVVITDAKCTRCVGFISASVVIALAMEQAVWWADSAAGLVLALYILLEAFRCLKTTYAEWKEITQGYIFAPAYAADHGNGGEDYESGIEIGLRTGALAPLSSVSSSQEFGDKYCEDGGEGLLRADSDSARVSL